MTHKSFHPTPRTLMGPGPSDVHPRVLAAMAQPTIGHLDPEFIALMDDIKSLMRYAFKTDNRTLFCGIGYKQLIGKTMALTANLLFKLNSSLYRKISSSSKFSELRSQSRKVFYSIFFPVRSYCPY